MKNAKKEIIAYTAFLRGINVGGNKKVDMAELKKALETLGFENVKTLLNSGNVVFETEAADDEKLQNDMQAALEKRFGFVIGVILRRINELEKLMAANPFAGIRVTPQTRLYVTFLQKKPKYPHEVDITSSRNNFRILEIREREVLSFLTITANHRGTTDAMALIEKKFGKNVTTRNWNTIQKILKADS